MPDPQTPETTPAPPVAPTFDMDALSTQVADKLKDSFKQAAPPPPPQPRVVPPQPVAAPDPMADLLRPYLEPIARTAAVAADSADDAAEFYGEHVDLEVEDRKAIELRFKQMKAAGLPLKREDIYKHYIGDNIEKVVEKRIKRRDEQLARAADVSTTVGSGSPTRGPQPMQDARTMTTPDLEKALAGQSF